MVIIITINYQHYGEVLQLSGFLLSLGLAVRVLFWCEERSSSKQSSPTSLGSISSSGVNLGGH